MSTYTLVVKSRQGIRRAVLTGADAAHGFRSLAIAMRINDAGMLETRLAVDSPVIAMLEIDGQIEVWRNQMFLFRTLFQDMVYTADERDKETFTATCFGEKDVLARAIIAWPASVINRSMFTNMRAESIMKTLVKYNLTPDATLANGRLLDNPTTSISIEPDTGRGNELSRNDMTGKTLLTELQDIAREGAVDFDLIKAGDAAWEFRVYAPQRGTDRTRQVVFSRDRGNIGQPTARTLMSTVRTAAVVGGAGEGTARDFPVRYGPDYTPDLHREVFVPYTAMDDGTSTALLQAAGDAALEAQRLHPTLDFTPLQATGARFGIDYALGDLVSGAYRGVATTFKVAGVSIGVQAGQEEDVVVELEQQ